MRALSFVKTIRERCRICYTCVRECPAKAIRIADGQAEVLPERCIGCGNCVRVCSQKAKEVLDSTAAAAELLAGPDPVTALVAPSFPAEFVDCTWRQFVGMTRAIGFDAVCEVAFGADLVADRYRRLLAAGGGRGYIATSCPAVVAFVERYCPEQVPNLAPIVSPMVATARALRALRGDGSRMVFIGPCVAKKGEAAGELLDGEVDAALTFVELRAMFEAAGITPGSAAESDFDPPHAGAGALFPISRGLLQAADIREDLISDEVVAADGRMPFVEAIKEFAAGDLKARLLEVLACTGCIMGAGISSSAPLFSRRARVSEFVRRRMEGFDEPTWRRQVRALDGLDLSRRYEASDQRMGAPFEEEIGLILSRMGKTTPEDELNCGACGYDTCREHAVAIFKGLAESEMCLPYSIEKLHRTVQELADSSRQLASTQEALLQSEKLASMGQLAAGIAHEVNNPLGVVLMYAHLLLDENGGDPALREDLQTIATQADRCKKIVSGLLNFARQTKVLRQPTDMVELVRHTLDALHPPEGVAVEIRGDMQDPMAEIDRDQVAQVLTNLVSNSCAAMPNGGRLTVTAGEQRDRVTLAVADTGVGIPPANLGKIFDPFFTTKQMGKGTGLGLSVTYGIVKMHGGDICLHSNADPQAGATGTTFTVTLPRTGPKDRPA